VILGHGKTADVELKNLLYMVRTDGWPVFVKWLREYGIEVSMDAVRNKNDEDATGKVFILDEIADQFMDAVESSNHALEDKYK
jgi:hypothetical protein